MGKDALAAFGLRLTDTFKFQSENEHYNNWTWIAVSVTVALADKMVAWVTSDTSESLSLNTSGWASSQAWTLVQSTQTMYNSNSSSSLEFQFRNLKI